MIGIDKLILNSVDITGIDWNKFNENPACTVKHQINSYSRAESGIEFSRLQVNTKKDLFYFDAGMALDRNTGQQRSYQKLFINPSSLLYGANIRNISTPSELEKALEIVCHKLKDDFGISISTTSAKISSIEINANIQLDHLFCDYAKAFSFIRAALPKRYKNSSEYMTSGETTGFSVENTRTRFKWYDKQREAAITADTAGQLLRIEYTFKTQEKVLDELGYDKLETLLSGFTSIKKAYANNIKSDILLTVPNALESEIKRHKSKLVQAMQVQPRAYIEKWLSSSQSIFDYELLQQALTSTLRAQKLTQRNNRQRIKQLQISLEDRQTGEEEVFFGQLKLLNEITRKLAAICGTC